MGVAALLLVAVHFAIQVQAQERAQLLVGEWVQKTGMQVGHVRYHLLRNALRLDRVTVNRDGMRLRIGQVLMQADPRALLESKPLLRRVQVSGLDAEFDINGPDPSWRNDPELLRFWSGARLLTATGQLRVRIGGGEPLLVANAELQLNHRTDVMQLSGRGYLGDAPIRLEWAAGLAGEEVESGRVSWRDVEQWRLAAGFGLVRRAPGLINGSLTWYPGRTGYQLAGEAYGQGAGLRQSLQWQGEVGRSGWHLSLEAGAWSLDQWREVLPQLAGRPLDAAHLTAKLDLAGEWRSSSWKLSSGEGELKDIRLRRDGDAAGWQVATLHYQGLHLSAAARRMRIGRVEIAGADAVVESEPVVNSPASIWRVNVQEMLFDGLTMRVQLPRGSMQLPAMQGGANWDGAGHVTFALTQRQGGGSGWHLKGVADVAGSGFASADFTVRVADLALGQLRPLLPLLPIERADMPVALGGTAALSLRLRFLDGNWHLEGNVQGENVSMAYAGDEWSAEKLALNLEQAGTGLAEQVASELTISGWRYIAPMQPLAAYDPEQANAGSNNDSWWKQGLREGSWRLARVMLVDGDVSIGRADLHWAQNINIDIRDLATTGMADIHAEAVMGDGSLIVSGKSALFAATPRFAGELVLKDVQPFFLADWLHASGAPRLLRGRVDSRLQVSAAGDGGYHVNADMTMRRPLVESGAFPDDPLLSRIGFRTSDALLRLADAKGVLTFEGAFDGLWSPQPLTANRLGERLLALLAAKIEQPGEQVVPSTILKPLEARVRMHETSGLTHNERARLRKVWRDLASHRDWVVDLVPRLPSGDIDAALVRRTRYTQSLIESFFTERGIAVGRIYAVWPMPVHQTGEVGGIQVLAGAVE